MPSSVLDVITVLVFPIKWMFSWVSSLRLDKMPSTSLVAWIIVNIAWKGAIVFRIIQGALSALLALVPYATPKRVLFLHSNAFVSSFVTMVTLNEVFMSMTLITDSYEFLVELKACVLTSLLVATYGNVSLVAKGLTPAHILIEWCLKSCKSAFTFCLLAQLVCEEPMWMEQALHKATTCLVAWLCLVFLRATYQVETPRGQLYLPYIVITSPGTIAKIYIFYSAFGIQVAGALLQWTGIFHVSWWETTGATFSTCVIGFLAHRALYATEQEAEATEREADDDSQNGSNEGIFALPGNRDCRGYRDYQFYA